MRTISRTKKLAAAGTLVLVGFGAGATAMVVSSASAEDPTASPSATPDGTTDGTTDGAPGDRRGGGSGETPLTGTTLTKVTAAVEAEYPGATIERAETDNGGVYEAHITTTDGDRLTVLVGKDFTVTGTEQHDGRGRGGDGGHGRGGKAPLTGTALSQVTKAVEAKYPGATIGRTHAEGTGYEAHVTTADGERLEVQLDASFAVTGSAADTGRGPGGKGPRGEKPADDPSAPSTPSDGATS